jgi:hypothetical protein
MADNFPLTPGTGRNAATDQVTHSGDSADVQLVRPVLVTGAEGSKTVVDLTGDNANGLDVDVTRINGNVNIVGVGTAGSASGGVLTVQGAASMTPLQIADNGGSLSIDDGAGSITVDGSVAITNASLTVINAGTFAVQVSGALPAGTNAIGKLAANSGVDIGDVDVTSVPSDPFGANADAASATGSISAKLRFIASTGIPITGTVTVGSHAVTNAGTFAVQVSSALPAGTNNIGDVDVLTVPSDPFGANADAASATGSISAKLRFIASTGIPITGTVTVGSHAVTNAGTFAVQSELESSSIRTGGTAATPKFAIIDAATSGDNTLVAAVASKKIRVLSLMLVAAGTVTVRFESGASGTALSGQMNLVANSGFTLPFNPLGWFETAVNTLLNLELSGAVSVDGMLTYVEV